MNYEDAYREVKQVKDGGWSMFDKGFLIKLVGQDGFDELVRRHKIVMAKAVGGRQYYKFNEDGE